MTNERPGRYGGEDTPYVRVFFSQLAPAWLEHVAIAQGYRPRPRESGFTYCDLGCGNGISTTVFASIHPEGRFYGIDAMRVHVESARAFARDAGATNVDFTTADFSAAAQTLPSLDMIVAHGVHSWVDEAARADLERIVAEKLAPGGLFYVSYNTLPGRVADVPLQRLVRLAGEACGGSASERVHAAATLVRQLRRMGVPAVLESGLAELFDEELDVSYIVHELMVSHWEPSYAYEVRRRFAKHGLVYVGSTSVIDNEDAFVLGAEARRILDGIDDDDLRLLVRDCFLQSSIRHDVFMRNGDERRLSAGERGDALLSSRFVLVANPKRMRWGTRTPAGRLSLDNDVAHHIVDALHERGALLLHEMAHGVDPDDLLWNLEALVGCSIVHPFAAPATATLRGAIAARREEVRVRVHASGAVT